MKQQKILFRAENINDLLSHDTFTVVSEGIKYQNEGGDFTVGCI